jgi:hypothetical protein
MAEKQTAKRNRREEILQSLALMLESSDGSQRITTAKLAAPLAYPKRRCIGISQQDPHV